MLRRIRQFYNLNLSPRKDLVENIYNITGLVPRQLGLYELAFTHRSGLPDSEDRVTGCNERLEYLGDAVLGAAVSELLFLKYPQEPEGYLTDMRSKIVSRRSLNEIGRKLGLDELLVYDKRNNLHNNSLIGNSFEALIGAIYLDHGYAAAKAFMQQRILGVVVDLDELEQRNDNYKSQLMEYVQKHKITPIKYELLEENVQEQIKMFRVAVRLKGQVMGQGIGPKKKVAEQQASQEALEALKARELQPA
jgi:ribonuclease-3